MSFYFQIIIVKIKYLLVVDDLISNHYELCHKTQIIFNLYGYFINNNYL